MGTTRPAGGTNSGGASGASAGGGVGRRVLLPMLVGVLVIAAGGYAYLDQERALASAVPVEATVVAADVEHRVTGSGEDRRQVYYPRVTYEYTVDGTVYRSSNLRPGLGREGMAESNARRTVEEHPVGAVVTAYYDPADPTRAYLLRERSWVPLVAVVLGPVFVLVGLFSGIRRLFRRLT